MAITLGFVFRISTTEWIAICIVIGLVFAMEAINTAIETLADYACNKQIDSRIAKAKDLAAAGVLMAAIAALVVASLFSCQNFFSEKISLQKLHNHVRTHHPISPK
jgi:diacylglycerol kinase